MPPLKLDLQAAAAVLAEGGEAPVTMAQVADRLGIAKPTLYRLAGSKAQLVNACVEAETERVLNHLHAGLSGLGGAPAPELLAEGLRAVGRYARESPGGFRLLFEGRVPEARDTLRRLESRVAELLRANARQAGRGPQRPDLLAAALLGAAAAVVSRALADGVAIDADAVAADLTAALER